MHRHSIFDVVYVGILTAREVRAVSGAPGSEGRSFNCFWWALQIQRLEGSLNGCQYYGLSKELSGCA
jgi:hypothetical protein